jgi:hypothetical protein
LTLDFAVYEAMVATVAFANLTIQYCGWKKQSHEVNLDYQYQPVIGTFSPGGTMRAMNLSTLLFPDEEHRCVQKIDG